MAKSEAKIKFTADASEFNDSIRESEKNLKVLRNQLKENNSEMKANGESQDGMKQRLSMLNREMELAKQKTEATSQKLELAKNIFGENSDEVKSLESSLSKCKNVENGIQADINKTNASLKKQEASSRQASTALGRLEDTINQQEAEVSNLETAYKNAVIQYGRTSSEADELKANLSKANRELQESKSKMIEADRAAAELADGFQEAGDEAENMGTSVGDIAAGNMIADFASNVIESITGLEEGTRQYRNEQAKLAAIAQTSGKSVDYLKNNYKDFYAITGDETLSSTAVANMSAMGLSTQNTNKLINAATGIWAKYGDSIPLDGLMESVNETANVGQVTGNLADALNWAGISEDDFNEKLKKCKNTQERQQLIVDTLNGKYGGLADTYRETNGATIEANNASTEMTDALSQLSETVAPVQSGLTSLAAKGIGFLAEHMDVIAPVATGAAVGLSGFWLVAGGGTTILNGAKTAMAGFNAVMAANPVSLIVVAIVALVTTFILLWNKCEGFRNFFIGMWTAIKSATSSAWNAIKKVFGTVVSGIVNGVKTKFSSMKNTVEVIFNAVKTVASTVWGGIKSKIINPVTNVVSIVKSKFSSLKSGVITIFNNIKSKAVSIFNGVKYAITHPVEAAKNTVGKIIDKIKGFFTRLKLKIPTPSLPKLPHFSLKMGLKKILGKTISYPTGFGVQWYAKAMNDPVILNSPTIFGSSGGNLLGGGEAGSEIVAGTDTLMTMISNAVESGSKCINIDELARKIAESCANQNIIMKVNKRELGRLVKEVV